MVDTHQSIGASEKKFLKEMGFVVSFLGAVKNAILKFTI
jgi:hypothetical protein